MRTWWLSALIVTGICLDPVSGVAALRFTIQPNTLDVPASVAEPGKVPVPLTGTNLNLEILDWATQGVETNVPGTFSLRFKAPLPGGTVLFYGTAEVRYQAGDTWEVLPSISTPPERLQVLAFPLDKQITAIQLKVPSHLAREAAAGKPVYQARLPYLTVLPPRLANVAAQAAVQVSSAEKPSQGFQPKPWLNRPETIVDAYIDARQNFASAPRTNRVTATNSEWVLLSWEQPQVVRGLGIFIGREERGFGQALIEAYEGEGDPRFASGTNAWRMIPTRITEPGVFRSNQFLVFLQPVESRGLRIRSVGGVTQIAVGEVAVFSDAPPGDVPLTAPPEGVAIPFTIPGPGKVTIQVRDEQGEVIANPVAGVEFPAGTNHAHWNLEDVGGKPVLRAGQYRWRGLYVPPLRVEFQHTFYPYPVARVAWQTETRTGGWLADHEPPRTIARAGNRMWLGAFAEAGDSIIETDLEARKLWGIDRIWVAIPHEICVEGDNYFGWCEGGWIGDNQAIIQIQTASKRSRKIFQRTMPKERASIESMRAGPLKRGVTGFQVVSNLAFVSFGKLDVVQVFDLSKALNGPWRGFAWDIAYRQFEEQQPVLLREIVVPTPGRIRKYGPDKLVTTSGRDVVVISLHDFSVTPLFTGKLRQPLGLGVDAAGNVFIGEGAPLHQVFGFSPRGEQVATLGKPGRREVGPFDVDDLEEPYGVEMAADGRVWVMEHSEYSKRVSIWEPRTGKCVKAVYGPTQYGGGGCLDPEDPTRLFYKGLELRRDPARGTVEPVNLYYRPDSRKFARFPDSDYPEYAFRSEGRLWMTSFMWPHGHPSLVLWLYQTNHVMPVAAIGSAIALRETFGYPAGNKADSRDWQNTDFLTNHIPGYLPDQKFFTWTDRNADGQVQPLELQFVKLEHEGKLLHHASAGWNWRMNARFEAAANAGQGRLVFFRPKGRTPQGYPIYDVPTNTVTGHGEAIGLDHAGNAIVLGGPLTAVQPDGKVRWRYRNDWPGLHAGHNTTARGDEPGVLIAPTRIWGIVHANDTLGEVVAFNSNLGCTYLMTAEDGLFIDRVFRDQRVGLLWRMPQPPSPEVLAETSLYDEHFGGTFQKVRGPDGQDHFYYVVGKNHCSVVELRGLDRIQRLSGGEITVTAGDIAFAHEQRVRAAARRQQPRIYTIRQVQTNASPVQIDGKDNEWPKERIDGFALAYDPENLYVLFRGADDRAVFENRAPNLLELFKGGDVLDVMLQTAPGADPHRTEAALGDVRLSFASLEGKPVCVLYDFHVEGHTGERVPFSSPWRTVWCDQVRAVTNAEIAVVRGKQEFTLEARIPLQAIHLNPQQLREIRGDVGRVLSDQTGSAAANRVYWSNKHTAIMSDLATEAALQPNLWGLFRFE